MDLTKLRNNQIQLIEHMQKGGYSHNYIRKIKIEIKKILKYGEEYNNYLDYYENFIKHNYTQKSSKDIIKSLNVIMNFDLYNKLPNRKRCNYKIIYYSYYSKLNNYYKSLIEFYKVEALKKDKKENSIHNEALNCSCFLFHLQNKGYDTFKNVKENDVINFFLDDNNQLKFSHSYEKNIKKVLKACIPYNKNCVKIVEMIPTIKSSRKNIDYLTTDEIQKIKEVLNNNIISLRDKAIVSLLLYTGIRSIDIANLKLSNIDWNNEVINIIQAKTDIPLQIPLTTSIGNSLYEYITKERQKTNFDNVFIRQDAIFPITSGCANYAVIKVFKEANIRQNTNKRKGTHIFRYNLATSLLKNEIPQPIISQVLGHNSSTSLRFYLNADFHHLKQCSLSIEQFKEIKEPIIL